MTPRPWRLLFSGAAPGSRNMAVDSAVFDAVEAGDSPPTLRLYAWDPACVSLGYFQDPARELDRDALRERGWDFVLRPTGGRAVLHAEELTYSVCCRRDEAPWCATLALSHRRIGQAWSEALAGFGLDLAEGEAEGGDAGDRARRGAAAPCFVSASRSELARGGRKVMGSAQRRRREAFLQHGSIPLSAAHEGLVEVLNIPPSEREAQKARLRRRAVSLGEIAPLPPDREAWTRNLAAAFCAALGVSGSEGVLTAPESAAAAKAQAEHAARQRAFFRQDAVAVVP